MCFPIYFGAPSCVNQNYTERRQQQETPWETASRVTLTALRAISMVGTVFAFASTLATHSLVALGTAAALAAATIGLFAIGDENPADAICWALRLLGESAHHFVRNENHGNPYLGNYVYTPPLPPHIPPSGGRVYQHISPQIPPAALPAPYPGAPQYSVDLAERAAVGRRETPRIEEIPRQQPSIAISSLLNDTQNHGVFSGHYPQSFIPQTDLAHRATVASREGNSWLERAVYVTESPASHMMPGASPMMVAQQQLPSYMQPAGITERAPVGRREAAQEQQPSRDPQERASVGRRQAQ